MKLKIKNLKFKKTKAFTLVEVLVSVGLFVIVIIVLSQVYISVIRSERIAYTLLNSENNIRNNLESITRSFRLGKDFKPLADGKTMCFDYYMDADWQNICYRVNEGNQTLERRYQIGEYMSLLDPQLKVKYLRFYYIKGSDSDSQESIIIVMEVATKVRNQEYLFNLQTAVTPRYLGVEI